MRGCAGGQCKGAPLQARLRQYHGTGGWRSGTSAWLPAVCSGTVSGSPPRRFSCQQRSYWLQRPPCGRSWSAALTCRL